MATRLAAFEITGLFGLYSHRIPLNPRERITIIIGPNGRGKTVCLKFIEALFRRRFEYFNGVPFKTATFEFSDGEKIVLTPQQAAAERTPDSPQSKKIQIALFAPGRKSIVWTPSETDKTLGRELRRFIPPEWEQVSFDVWRDRRDGEQIALAELLERFHLSPHLAQTLKRDTPKEIDALLNQIDCHLIETQRLLVLPSSAADDDEFVYRHRPGARRVPASLAIQEKAGKLKSILKERLTQSAILSQSLDRTFPLRVFEAQGSAQFSEEQLRRELEKLDARRKALMAAGILDKDYQQVALHSGKIESGVAKALEIYVQDNGRKLDVFNDLRQRVDLFKELMESRLIDKSIQIDQESGFKVLSKTTAQVPLDKLSSGEQHQLILVFDLLFEVTKNALILIDEPELSLHVAWQRTFIESLERMIALNEFDVLLATHSPALIAKHLDLTVELGPVDG